MINYLSFEVVRINRFQSLRYCVIKITDNLFKFKQRSVVANVILFLRSNVKKSISESVIFDRLIGKLLSQNYQLFCLKTLLYNFPDFWKEITLKLYDYVLRIFCLINNLQKSSYYGSLIADVGCLLKGKSHL